MAGMRPDNWRLKTQYNTQRFKDAKRKLREEFHYCYVVDENGPCRNRGTIPDHVPPVSHFADPRDWQGIFLPQCKKHSDKQSGMVRHGRTYPVPSRQW